MSFKQKEDLNLRVFNIITRINKLKSLKKHLSYGCKSKFDSRKCYSKQKSKNNKCCCKCTNLKEQHACKKDYIWNPATCCCENGKYLASIIAVIIANIDSC